MSFYSYPHRTLCDILEEMHKLDQTLGKFKWRK